MESPYSEIEFEVSGGVAIIRFSRESEGNALNATMALELESALNRCDWESEVTAVVLTGAGDQAFSIGIGVDESGSPDLGTAALTLGFIQAVNFAILDLKKPIVAAINGLAAGTGLQYAFSSDWRIGCSRSRIGLFGEHSNADQVVGPYCAEWQLPRSVSQRMAYTGQTLGVHECRRYGLINEVVRANELTIRAVDRANQLTRLPALAFKCTKSYFSNLLRYKFAAHIKSTTA